jgi:hypothetical protein
MLKLKLQSNSVAFTRWLGHEGPAIMNETGAL